MRIDVTQEEFDKMSFVRIKQLTAKTYEAECTCPRCGGRGFVTFSSVDNARCWQCNETGKVIGTIRIVKRKQQLTLEEMQQRVKEFRERTRKHWLDKGFKKVDFEQAEWLWKICEVWFCPDDYYRIVKESDKAYLMEQVCNIDESQAYSSHWVPKKAIKFKEV